MVRSRLFLFGGFFAVAAGALLSAAPQSPGGPLGPRSILDGRSLFDTLSSAAVEPVEFRARADVQRVTIAKALSADRAAVLEATISNSDFVAPAVPERVATLRLLMPGGREPKALPAGSMLDRLSAHRTPGAQRLAGAALRPLSGTMQKPPSPSTRLLC